MSDTTNQVEEPTASGPSNELTKKSPLHPLVIASAAISALAGLLLLSSLPDVSGIIGWAASTDNAAPAVTWISVIVIFIAPLLALGASAYVLLKRDITRYAWTVVAAYVLPCVLFVVTDFIWFAVAGFPDENAAERAFLNFFPLGRGGLNPEGFAYLLLLINIVVAWIAVFVIKNSQASKSVTNQFGGTTNMTNQQPVSYDQQTGAPIYGQPVQAQPIGYDPRNGAPIYGQVGYMRPESPLPLVALIGGILFPLLGIIVGHIALGQMRRGEIPSSNMSLAKTGLILGYVFTGLGILAVVAYIAIFAAIAGSGLYF